MLAAPSITNTPLLCSLSKQTGIQSVISPINYSRSLLITNRSSPPVLPPLSMYAAVIICSESKTQPEISTTTTFPVLNVGKVSTYIAGIGFRSSSTTDTAITIKSPLTYVSVGSALEGKELTDAVSIRYKIEGGQEHRIAVKSGSNYITMCSEQNDTFQIVQGGRHSVTLQKCTASLDLNRDGLTSDYYIQLSYD